MEAVENYGAGLIISAPAGNEVSDRHGETHLGAGGTEL